ncbi:MAG: glycosyltransferase family 4 protein [Micrococcales bacterium]|nr:glycosyltransferase family 4 protein [Micrococcales bacterium]
MTGDGPRRRLHRVTVASRLFSPEVAAAAFRLRALADAFADAGLAVDVVTTTPPGTPPGCSPPITDGTLRVHRWPALRDDNGNIRGYLHYLSYDLPLAARLVCAPRPDLYVAEPPPTTGAVVRVVAGLRRRPYLYYAADIWSEAAGSAGAPAPLVALLRRLESWAMRGATRVLAVSEEVASRVDALGVDAARVTVVGNGVDTDLFKPDGPSASATEPYFVYTGTMSEWQGAEVFIEGLSAHRSRGSPGRAVFLGQGSELAALRDCAQRLAPGAVDFLGIQPPEVAASWLRGAAAALVSIRPGLGYDFARPTKIYAATACGTPVIFAGAGAARRLVTDDGLGWGVDHDPAAVAEAMDLALARVAEPDTPPSPEHLVRWTTQHASLWARANAAVAAILDTVAQTPAR